MLARHAVLLTPSPDGSCPAWSYLHTGTLPRLISFVSHSYENTGGVGVFFPFWHSHVGYQGFNPGNERPSKSSTDYCQLITDHCALTCANPVGVTATLALTPLAATLMDLPASVANKGLTAWLSPLDATFTKNRGVGARLPMLRRPAYTLSRTLATEHTTRVAERQSRACSGPVGVTSRCHPSHRQCYHHHSARENLQ